MNLEQKIKLTAAISLPILIICFYVTASLHFSYTPDDTYIYLQYARNLINGDGVSFNAGEPSYGFTSPLWLGIIALGGKMGVDIYIAAKALDLFLGTLSIAVFYLLAFEMIRDTIVALLATIAFSFNAWLIRWAGSGMESSLAVLLVLLTFWYCMRNDYALATVFTTLLTLVRPESCILIGIIVMDLYINSNNKVRAIKFGISLILYYIAFLTPWLVYAYITFGSFLPNTAYAKSGMHFQFDDIIATFLDAAQTLGATEGISIILVLVCGSFLFLKRKTIFQGEEPIRFFLFRESFTGLVWVGGILAFYIFTGVNVVSRYLLLISPIVIIMGFLLLQFALRQSKLLAYMYLILLSVSVLIVAQNQIMYSKVVLPGIQEFENGMETCLTPIGQWLRMNTSPSATVVTCDIGAIGYRSQRKIIDAAGLATRDALPLLRSGMTPLSIIETKAYLKFSKPDYVIGRSSYPNSMQGDTTMIPLLTKVFSRLDLQSKEKTYYTVYQVRYPEISQ